MKVHEICTGAPTTCPVDGTLADVARIMWNGDCGSLPVVDPDGKVVGMISDRDITLAVLTKGRAPQTVEVREAMSGNVYSCRPEDDVRLALRTMAQRHVHRLPVVDGQGTLQGILSISDCIRNAKPLFEVDEPGVPSKELNAALQALSTPWKRFFGKGTRQGR